MVVDQFSWVDWPYCPYELSDAPALKTHFLAYIRESGTQTVIVFFGRAPCRDHPAGAGKVA